MKSFIIDYIKTSNINDMTNTQALRSLTIMDYMQLFRLPDDMQGAGFTPRKLSYFADRNIFIARQNPEDTTKGIIGAIKGGHNNEGHNHNDVAQFTVYSNGKPLIVDTGAGTYTRKTFSTDRYSIWWIGGMGHNAPQINGNYQLAGIEYHAKVKDFNPDIDSPSITFDITKIYDAGAGIKEAVRKFTVDRKNGRVLVDDSVSMQDCPNTKVELKLFTPQKVASFSENTVKWQDSELILKNIRCTSVTEVDLEGDAKLINVWDKLYCITLTADLKNSGTYNLEFIAK